MPINITYEQAKEIVDNQANGALEAISAGKGGRVWLEGEWRLDELEALCVMVRHQAGGNAYGAEEFVKDWENEKKCN